jgi:hypothetical protein
LSKRKSSSIIIITSDESFIKNNTGEIMSEVNYGFVPLLTGSEFNQNHTTKMKKAWAPLPNDEKM